MHRFEKWRQSIQLAPDQKTVAGLVVDYVAGLVPSDVARLPLRCQKALQDPVSDIQGTAVTLLQEELAYIGDPGVAEFLNQLAHTFAAASIRLGQLQGRAEPTVPKP